MIINSKIKFLLSKYSQFRGLNLSSTESSTPYFPLVEKLQAVIQPYTSITIDGKYGSETYRALQQFAKLIYQYDPMHATILSFPTPEKFNHALNKFLAQDRLWGQLNQLTYPPILGSKIDTAVQLLQQSSIAELHEIAKNLKAGNIKLDQNLVATISNYFKTPPEITQLEQLFNKILRVKDFINKSNIKNI